MVAWLRYGNGETPESSGIKGDHLVGNYYVAFDKHYKEEQQQLIAQGLTPEDAEQQAPIMLEAREMLRQWEAGDPTVRQLWQQMNSWVYAGFDQTYERLGIHFDKVYHESETYLLGKALVEEGLSKGVFYKHEDGSVRVNLEADGLDEKVLLRKDGTSVYITQDIGTAQLRHEEFHPQKMIYVVGNEQNYHFDVLKLILGKKLEKPFGDTILHLSYGMVELPNGKMKSREGTVVDADDLMDAMHEEAKASTEALGKFQFTPEEADKLYEMVGLGALKYFILKVDPTKNMLFNPEESIDFNGNTAPFIQYTHARICSLLRKADEQQLPWREMLPSDTLLNDDERELVKTLYQYPGTVLVAGDNYSPAVIANYIYDLAKQFNRFYQETNRPHDSHHHPQRHGSVRHRRTGKDVAFPLLHLHPHPCGMRLELRRVHALDMRDTIAKVTRLRGKKCVFKDIFALRHPVDEEMGGRIPRGLIIPQTVLVFVLGEYIDRFKSGRTHVLEMHKLHVAVAGDDHPHTHLVALLQRLIDRDGLQHLALIGTLHLVELFFDNQVLVITAGDLVQILKILPVKATPRGTVGTFLQTHVRLVGCDFFRRPRLLKIAGARLGLHGLVRQSHLPNGQ